MSERNENVSLRESLAGLLALYDGFKEGDFTHEEAYYSFYEGECDKWEKARNLLANDQHTTKED